MKTLRIAALAALVALAATGCLLISGQFVVTYQIGTFHAQAFAFAGTRVDLNTVGEYEDHKSELKRVEDLAIVGDFTNNTATATSVEVWIVPSSQINLSQAQVTTQGVRLWGPLALAANATERVDWNRSATLFKGRPTLIDEIKGDGDFALYVIAPGSFDITLSNGAVIAVIGAAK